MDKAQNEYCEWAEIYALGGLNEDDIQQFENHLSECADCREQVGELKKIIDVLPLAAFEVPPPEGMKKRVLGRILAVDGKPGDSSDNAKDKDNALKPPIAAEPIVSSLPAPAVPEFSAKRYPVPTKRNIRLRILCAALAATAAVLAMYATVLHQDMSGLRKELAVSEQNREGLQKQIALVNSPSRELKVNKAVVLDPAAEDIVARGLATIVIDSKGTHLLVQAEKLPELSGSEAFQVWLMKGDIKKSAGTFLTSKGTGVMYYTFDPKEYDTVAITLEPDGQGEQPRGRMILAAEIEG
ncbi:anti-sigma factor [Paenibacillus wynnii]|uniref:anti-sigma factor n=1 Tax=Paenibacillus wynnii TaxID=268407 RepID=UPI0027940990|nr:anti-sigma factor [Paenibacillus wynnii]MDQ0195210.1 anti-sigma-K factor RskA [Paenibacillus wynnii]